MLGITSKNRDKCDLETIIGSNGQYFWINLRNFELVTESKWLNIFNKCGNKSTLKYRREITPDIKIQADKIFVRNDLFEQVNKSCKASNKEYLIFLKKLGVCLYEENYYIEEILQIKDKEPSINESDNKSINEQVNSNSTSSYDTDKFNKILLTITTLIMKIK